MKNSRVILSILSISALVWLLMSCDYRNPNDSDGNQQSGYFLTATVDADTIYADDGRTVAHVRASLRNELNEPLPGQLIKFAANSGVITGEATTSTSGIATATFDDEGDPTDSVGVIVRYTDANDVTVRDTVKIVVRPITDQVKNMRFDPLSDITVDDPDKSYSVEISVQVLDEAPSPIRNVPVRFKLLNNPSIGTLSQPIDTSNTSGKSQVTFNSYAGELGTVIVKAYVTRQDAEDAVSKTGADIDFDGIPKVADTEVYADTATFDLVSPDQYNLVLVSSRDTIFIDDGATFAKINATLKDVNGQPVKGASIRFSSSNDIGVINSPVKTDSFGVAGAVFRDLGDPDRVGSATIMATYTHPYHGDLTQSVQVYVKRQPIVEDDKPHSITLRAQYYVLPAGPNEDIFTTQIHATVQDSSGDFVPTNTPVYFGLSPPDRGIIDPVAVTGDSGTATVTYSSGSKSGFVTISALVYTTGDENVTSSFGIRVKPGLPEYIQIPAAVPNKIQVQGGGGLESSTIRAELYDSNGQLVANPTTGSHEVEFELGPFTPTGARFSNGQQNIIVEANNGMANATLNAGTGAGNVRVRATLVGHDSITAVTIPVVIEAGPPHLMEAQFNANSADEIGGGVYEVELGVLARDQYSNPVPDSTQVYWFIQEDSLRANVDGTSFTGNENLDGDGYPGIAFTKLRYPTNITFAFVTVHAIAFGVNGDSVSSIATWNGQIPRLPFVPGTVTLAATPGVHDFSTDGNPVVVTFQVSIQNSYGTPVGGADIQFNTDRQPQSWNPPGRIVTTGPDGMATATATFTQTICPQIANTDPPQYETVDVTAWAVSLLPRTTASNEIVLTFSRSYQP